MAANCSPQAWSGHRDTAWTPVRNVVTSGELSLCRRCDAQHERVRDERRPDARGREFRLGWLATQLVSLDFEKGLVLMEHRLGLSERPLTCRQAQSGPLVLAASRRAYAAARANKTFAD
jgi:hypothetical protein